MISCPFINPHDPEDWGSIEKAFRHAPVLTFSQHWLLEPEPDFLPGTVRLGHNGSALLGVAYLPDQDIFTRATQDQEMMFQLGDVFEIFLQNSELKSYVEFHVAPNGKRLQLVFPDHARELMKHSPIESFMVDKPLFDFRVIVGEGFWKIWFAIPFTTLDTDPKRLLQSQWRASFSRYDYTRDRENPVLSSTSPHQKLDYHRLEEWTPLSFA